MRDCVAKGINFVHCFAAGFCEPVLKKAAIGKRNRKIATDGGVRLSSIVWASIVPPPNDLQRISRKKKTDALLSQSGRRLPADFLCQDVNLYSVKSLTTVMPADWMRLNFWNI